MNTLRKLVVPLLAGVLVLAMTPALNATPTTTPLDKDHPGYKPVDISDTILLNPANWIWVTQGSNGLFDDEPLWVALSDASPNKQYRVTVTSTGPVVASMDVYQLVPVTESPDRVTPGCPQGLLTEYLYPKEGESAGSYLLRQVRLGTEEHQMTAPVAAESVSVTLDANRNYMLIVDGRLGSGSLDVPEEASITYSVELVGGGVFNFGYPPKGDGDRPPLLRLPTWAANQNDCIMQGPVLPPGIPEPPEPPASAPGLPELGVDLEDLLGTSL